LQQHLDFLKSAVQERTRAISANGYGIIDSENPRYNYDGGSKSLWPVLNTSDYTKITVYPGKAVTLRGDVIEVQEAVTVTVASLQRNAVSLIVLQYQEVQSNILGLTTSGQTVSVGYESSYTVYTAPVESYLDRSVFTADVLADVVILASVVWTDSDVPLLLTDNSYGYDFVRPWFSAVDVEHRNSVGSGTVSVTNPHGTSLNDLTVGTMTLYDQLTNSGMILSKDTSIPGVPGYFCLDQFDATTIKVDYDGSKTSRSWFSRPGCKYIELSAIPNVMCGAWTTGNKSQEWAVDWIKGTAICVIISNETPTALDAYYVTTATGRIGNITASSITFGSVSNKDLVITGGVSKTNLLRTTVPLKRYGSIPRKIGFIAGPHGQVYSDPTVLVPSTSVSQYIGKTISVDAVIPAPGHVGVGLTDGMKSIRTSFCAVQVEGTATDGSTIQEVLTFDAYSWSDASVPALHEETSQVHFTEQVFSSVTSVSVLNTDSYRTTDVGSAAMYVYLKQDAVYSKYATLANGFWDGNSLVDVRDSRRVLSTVKEGIYGYTSIHQAAELMPGIDDVLGKGKRAQLVFAEDFSQPVMLAASTVEWEGTSMIDYNIIPVSLADSSQITGCYRSRQVPLKIDPASWTKICVILFNSDASFNTYGSVRAVFQKDGVRGEACLFLQKEDPSKSVYVGFAQTNWASVSIVVSGRCNGLACYFVFPETADPDYTLTTK
jgi:hypothetical protein